MCDARIEYERLEKERKYKEYISLGLNQYVTRKPTEEFETIILLSGLAADIETLMAACSKVLARLK